MIKDKKTYRILVIEDNAGDFVIVEDMLSDQILHPEIIHAINYKEAANILATDRGFHVILMDLSLPDKSGPELVREITKLASACCPVIVLTGYADLEFGIRSIALGVYDYLQKDDLTGAALYKSIIYSIERMKNGLEIIASEKRYSDLFHGSPQPMWVFDTETFCFIQVNKATLELYGYSEDEFLNMTVRDLKPDRDISFLVDFMKNESPQGDLYKHYVQHIKKNGEVIDMEIYSNRIILKEKKYRSVIAIDVTGKNLHENNITKAIIKTQEDERYEIGSELHDNVCQILAASQMSLGMYKHRIAPDNPPELAQGREFITLALKEIRNLSHRLAPAFFDGVNLKEAFGKLFKNFDPAGVYKIVLHLDDEVSEHNINRDIQLNIYRILQEQLRNIFKYAHATIITVDVCISNGGLKMKVSDNGTGFNTEIRSTGIGFANMKRRAELFSGKMGIESLPGKGCTIIIDIPLHEPALLQHLYE